VYERSGQKAEKQRLLRLALNFAAPENAKQVRSGVLVRLMPVSFDSNCRESDITLATDDAPRPCHYSGRRR
jgi:hypothetical protein